MDKYTAQGDGFPADNEFLMLIQSIVGEVANLAALGGADYILKGCVNTAGTVSSGFMVLNGEVVRFQGGAIGTEVTIIETVENATYLEDISPADGQGDSKPTYFYRTAQFGNTGVYTVDWADLSRINPIVELQKAATPVGAIVMWAGSIGSIPTGWALCDGTNSTPNLSGKFIVGYDSADADYNAIGDQGGAKTVALTEAQMPQHNHTGTVTIPPHKHTLPKTVPGIGGGSSNALTNIDNIGHTAVTETNMSSSSSGSVTTNNKGSNEAHENRPPYYTLAYIQFKG